MENNSLGRYTTSFGVSLAVTSILSAILVVIKEASPSMLALMKSITGHHWSTHGVLAVVVFFLIGWGLGQMNNRQGLKMTVNSLVSIIVGGIVVSGLIIAGFYLLEG